MYGFLGIHESRNLKQARPQGQDVDLLRIWALTTPSLGRLYHRFQILSRNIEKFFLHFKKAIDKMDILVYNTSWLANANCIFYH